MKLLAATAVLIALSLPLQAHDGGHGTPLRTWQLQSTQEVFGADFVKLDQLEVWLRDASHDVVKVDLADLSLEDQEYVLGRHRTILALNAERTVSAAAAFSAYPSTRWLLTGGSLLLLSGLVLLTRRRKSRLVYGMLGAGVVAIVACADDNATLDSEPAETFPVPRNDVSFMQSLFEQFPGVTTAADDTYLYVGSNGLPDHGTMVGITNWQQQVPIEQDYTGANRWAIPLQPVLAEHPLSTRTNLLKGAIAIAANGIPIFNPLNNRGEDANAIGELDQWGGHCGRADDYHYHLPPTHLQATVGAEMPIAYAVDGFPVYGETTEVLDEYLGRFTADSSYQYHAVAYYPYLIAGMRGEVTLDPNTSAPENQVIPQARTRETRPAGTPLRGAVITAFDATGPSGYSLTYVLNAETYVINYDWDDRGLYTFEFVSPDGTTRTETYQK